jgi:hypothetical protein
MSWLPVRGVRMVAHAGVPLLDQIDDAIVVTISTAETRPQTNVALARSSRLLVRALIAIVQTNVLLLDQEADIDRDHRASSERRSGHQDASTPNTIDRTCTMSLLSDVVQRGGAWG